MSNLAQNQYHPIRTTVPKLHMLLGLLLVVLAVDTQAAVNKEPLWRQVSSIKLKASLVEANQGGRAALCSWVDEHEAKTTVLVGVKNNEGNYGINKLVYSLDKNEPIMTYAKIPDLNKFQPRTILRTSSGTLYLTANSSIDNSWTELWTPEGIEKKHSAINIHVELTSPQSLLGGVWISIDAGDNWIEVKSLINSSINNKKSERKSIKNAGYMAHYKLVKASGTIDATAVRVGGSGVNSNEIVCFMDKASANNYLTTSSTSNRDGCVQKLDDTHYLVISTVIDRIQGNLLSLEKDPLLTRIGEIPIGIDGMDLGLNAIRFTYVTNGRGHEYRHTPWIKLIDIGFGTPIFNTYCDNDNKKELAKEIPVRKCEPHKISDYHHGDTNKCFPNGWWYADDFDRQNKCLGLNSSSISKTTKDKYRNCVVTQDNTGLFLTKLNQVKGNSVEAYLGQIGTDARAPRLSTKIFNNPQETVAQYYGFMAIVDEEQKIWTRELVTNTNTNLQETTAYGITDGRIMISGVHPLDWNNTKDKKNRYNGRLIALSKLEDELLVKLYMRATQPSIEFVTTDNRDAINYTITGEPYAKIKYWWQKADKNGNFAQLTRAGIEKYEDLLTIDNIVGTDEVVLDQNGYYIGKSSYKPEQTGTYRLIASAIVGGFYCDYDTDQPDYIGTASEEKHDITITALKNTCTASISNPSFVYNNTKEDYTNATNIIVDSGKKVSFKVNAATNSTKEGKLVWYLDDNQIASSEQLVYQSGIFSQGIVFDNNDDVVVKKYVRVEFAVKGKDPCIQEFTVTVNPKLIAPEIQVYKYHHYYDSEHSVKFDTNSGNNICNSNVVELTTKTTDNVTWYKEKTNTTFEKVAATTGLDNSINNDIHRVLQLASGPALNKQPNFIDTSEWEVGKWKTVNINPNEDNLFEIANVLRGTTKQILRSNKFILVDSSCSYLYMAAAKTEKSEPGIKLTLSIECYDKNQKKIDNITLPEAVITNTWSSYGDVINNAKHNIQNKKYPWPKNTAFVKLAIKLPESNHGTNISAVRLLELPEETLKTLSAYKDREEIELLNIADIWTKNAGYNTAEAGQTSMRYQTEISRNGKTARSTIFQTNTWPGIFFTNYRYDTNLGSELLQPDEDPKKPIVVKVRTNTGSRSHWLMIDVYPKNEETKVFWETNIDNTKFNDWITDKDNNDKYYYRIEVSDQDRSKGKVFFVRCRAEIQDLKNPCNGLSQYSRIFKVVIEKAKKEEN